MLLPHPWLLGFCVTGLLLLLGATSGLINARLWMSEPLVCAIAGVLLGPLVFNLIQIHPGTNPAARAVTLEAARITLAIAVLAAAIRLPRGWLRRNWRGLAVALGPGMILMWIAGTLITLVSFGLPILTCLLIGAIIAPTDPVLSAPVVSGSLANRAVPADLRHAITAESGINDGLALPIVMLPIFLILSARHGDAGHSLSDWGLHSIAIETGSAVVVGIVIGYLARVCMRWAGGHPDADPGSLLTIALFLALATLTGLHAMGGNGVLGVFIAGAALNEAYGDDYTTHQEHFNEAISRFFDLPIMFLLGAAAPWHAWIGLGWGGAGFVLGILFLRRIPAWLLLRRWMPWARPLSQTLFAGWFGPIGAAALFYSCEAQDMTGLTMLWPIVSLAAAASVVAHGITGTHATAFLGRQRDRMAAAETTQKAQA
jgi:NhaP-type Na+/H+ or K+/H+ antiporter